MTASPTCGALAGSARHAHASLALAESLRSDAFYAAITADHADQSDQSARRVLTLRHYFDYAMAEGERIGRCVLAPDATAGAAVWLLPAAPAVLHAEAAAKEAFLKHALGPIGLAHYHRIVDFMVRQQQAVVSSDDWYLSIVGVSPASQGQGIGARLLQRTLSEALEARAGCYLETFTPRNLPFYERLGFRTVTSPHEPTTGATYAIMRKDA